MVHWYRLSEPDLLDSPALLVYPNRAAANIDRMLAIAGAPDRVRPHVKTHKTAPIIAMHLARGIRKFKCATIAEADMLASSGAGEILLAYQPVGPKLDRLINLASDHPDIQFGCLVDHEHMLGRISKAASAHDVVLQIWVDINTGMNRTGIIPGPAAQALYLQIATLPGVKPGGLHAFDGHIMTSDRALRQSETDAEFEAVMALRERLSEPGRPPPGLVAGSTPTFPIHAQRENVETSPGTFVYWEGRYEAEIKDLPFEPAALVITRVVSKPAENLVTLDLGHKAIASEHPIDKRVVFLNAQVDRFVSQSEEHLVVEVADAAAVEIGDLWYGQPWHICPTVALYQEAVTVRDGQVGESWEIVARRRRIRY
jgi:D-serine deaminase-like pyridoxal phosphate-dependent protein